MTDATAPPDHLEFHYIKGTHYRVIYADGAYGGITPRGMVQFTLYNERSALPRKGEVSIGPGGVATPETITDTRGGVVREYEATIVMTLENAEALRTWLDGHITQLRALTAAKHD